MLVPTRWWWWRRLQPARPVRLLAVLVGALSVAKLVVLVLLAGSSVPRTANAPPPALNASKLGLLIDSRPLPVLAPLALHFMAVLPPDWRFLFLGSAASLAAINASAAVRNHVAAGKLSLRALPATMSAAGQEDISRCLTSRWLYETAVAPAEWLLVFQTDSMVCANSKRGMHDFLAGAFDWVGAPWDPRADWGGNGGLSLRRVSRIVELLRREDRAANAEPEDVWLSSRLARAPAARMANGSVSLTFSAEMHSGEPERVVDLPPPNATTDAAWARGLDDWRHGFYEPMGYHTGGSGKWLHAAIWGTPELRRHVWNYCPEIKMTLAMDVARYVPGTCGTRWT